MHRKDKILGAKASHLWVNNRTAHLNHFQGHWIHSCDTLYALGTNMAQK